MYRSFWAPGMNNEKDKNEAGLTRGTSARPDGAPAQRSVLSDTPLEDPAYHVLPPLLVKLSRVLGQGESSCQQLLLPSINKFILFTSYVWRKSKRRLNAII